jgi:hypothetical protein
LTSRSSPWCTPHYNDPHLYFHTFTTNPYLSTPEVQTALDKHPSPLSCVIVGIESHICVTQTALDLLRAGHKVYIIADGVSSCNKEEVPVALARLRGEGAVVTTSESWLYECVGDAGRPEYVYGGVGGCGEMSANVLGLGSSRLSSSSRRAARARKRRYRRCARFNKQSYSGAISALRKMHGSFNEDYSGVMMGANYLQMDST